MAARSAPRFRRNGTGRSSGSNASRRWGKSMVNSRSSSTNCCKRASASPLATSSVLGTDRDTSTSHLTIPGRRLTAVAARVDPVVAPREGRQGVDETRQRASGPLRRGRSLVPISRITPAATAEQEHHQQHDEHSRHIEPPVTMIEAVSQHVCFQLHTSTARGVVSIATARARPWRPQLPGISNSGTRQRCVSASSCAELLRD